MLSDQTIAIVKSTAPILQEHGETLTKHFYKKMFTNNPEVAPYFNPAHQQSGAQQRALAGAICAYAEHIDDLSALENAVELIAQKHASLLIRPDQYPIVGSNLLASIQEVLGDGATDEIINAWGEAYNFLADILINREGQIYKEQSDCINGWEGFKRFKIMKKVKESDIISSFYLVPELGEGLPDFKPGQYITVRMEREGGVTTMRNYSLSDVPGLEYFRISVKREIGGKSDTPKGFVSNQLHDNYEVGDTIEVAPPCGEFTFKPQENNKQPLVFIAGGIGITPIMSMLQSALVDTKERPIVLIYACMNEQVQGFKDTLDKLSNHHARLKIQYCFSESAPQGYSRNKSAMTGFIDAKMIESLAPDKKAEFYFCGPKEFMTGIYQLLNAKDIPESQMHYEFFGPKQDLDTKAA